MYAGPLLGLLRDTRSLDHGSYEDYRGFVESLFRILQGICISSTPISLLRGW